MVYSLEQDSLAGSLGGCEGAYSLPRHHIDAAGTSFLGSGSQKYCTMRLHFSMSMVMVGAGFQLSVAWLWWFVVWMVVIQYWRGVDIERYIYPTRRLSRRLEKPQVIKPSKKRKRKKKKERKKTGKHQIERKIQKTNSKSFRQLSPVESSPGEGDIVSHEPRRHRLLRTNVCNGLEIYTLLHYYIPSKEIELEIKYIRKTIYV